MKTSDSPDIKKLSLDIIRDLYSASRKIAMYPLGHPNTNETLIKSVERFNEIFGIKRSFVIQIFAGRMLAEGILLENNVYVGGMLLDLKKHDINSVTFSAELALGDLYHFLCKLLEQKSPIDNQFYKYLNNQNVKTIFINSPQPLTIYNFDESAIGAPNAKFLLNDRLAELTVSRTDLLLAYYLGKLNSDEQIAQKLGVDFRLAFVKRNIPDIIANIPEPQALEIFQQVIYSSNWLGEQTNSDLPQGIRLLWKDYAGDKRDISIILPIFDMFRAVGAPLEIINNVFDKSALSKLKGIIDAEQIIRFLETNHAREIDFGLLKKTVNKLAADKYIPQLNILLKRLLSGLTSDNTDTRQRSLRLVIEAINSLAESSSWDIFSTFIKEMLQQSIPPNAGVEVIELVERVAETAAANSRWPEFNIALQSLKTIARESKDTRMRLASERLEILANSPVLTDIVVDAVISGKGGVDFYEAISSTAFHKIAAALVTKIDSNDKAIRARVIKALSSMGKSIGPEIVNELSVIVGAGEKDDDKVWYRLRNLMRVIGLIKYVEALPYFEILAGWQQKRIKLEVISALEIMQSPYTGQILSKLATSPDSDIRKAAVVGIGMSGHPDMIKYIRNLFDDHRSDRILLVAALGRLGGAQGRDALIDLYENDNYYTTKGLSKKDEENLKMAIIRVMVKFGDDISRSKVEHYSRQWLNKEKGDIFSATAKILMDDHPRN